MYTKENVEKWCGIMKKIWIMGLVVIMAFLSGCNLYSSGKVEVTKKEHSKNEVENEVEVKKLSFEEYTDELFDLESYNTFAYEKIEDVE